LGRNFISVKILPWGSEDIEWWIFPENMIIFIAESSLKWWLRTNLE
jgi:hypothetical protein